MAKIGGNRKPQTFRNCARCGQRFGPLDRLSRRFCSLSCKSAAQKDQTTAKRGRRYEHLDRARVDTCLVCKAEYKARSDHAGRQQRYCSHDCYMRSREETTIEAAVRGALASAGITFETQRRIGNFYVDFLTPGNVVVEADGDYWHSLPDVAAKDKRKDAYLSAQGYRVLHLSESEIRQGTDVIVKRWQNFTGQTAELEQPAMAAD